MRSQWVDIHPSPSGPALWVLAVRAAQVHEPGLIDPVGAPCH